MSFINLLCVIDDDNIYQYTVRKTAEKSNVVKNLITFDDGEKAMTFFTKAVKENFTHEELPDVILLDINMPVMDGWEFLERYILLKPKIGKKIHLYMVSSSVHETDVQRAKEISEVSDYIVKPITREHFANIADLLDTHLN